MGRPRKGEGVKKTRQIRVAEEQGAKLELLWTYGGISSADFIGPLIDKALDRAIAALRRRAKALRAMPEMGD